MFTVHSANLLASFFLACVLCVGTEHCRCPTWTHLICQYAADGVSDDHCDLPSAYRLGHSKFTYIYILCIYIYILYTSSDLRYSDLAMTFQFFFMTPIFYDVCFGLVFYVGGDLQVTSQCTCNSMVVSSQSCWYPSMVVTFP